MASLTIKGLKEKYPDLIKQIQEDAVTEYLNAVDSLNQQEYDDYLYDMREEQDFYDYNSDIDQQQADWYNEQVEANLIEAEQEFAFGLISRINDNKLFSINSWPQEDEDEAFAKIWLERLDF